MRLLVLFFAAILATPLHAQNWFTQEVCRVEKPTIHEEEFAPATLATLQGQAHQMPNPVGKYWRITSPDGKASYLWGTFHSNDPMLLDLPDRVKKDLAEARVVATEVDFVARTRQDYYGFVTSQNHWHTNGRPEFSNLGLPPDIDHWIRTRFDAIGWGYHGPDTLNLSAIASILLFDPCSDFAHGVHPIQDFYIQLQGEINGASVLGLEPPRALENRLDDGRSLGLNRSLIAVYGAYLNPEITEKTISTYYRLYLDGQLGLWMAWERSYFEHLYPDGRGLDWLDQTDAFLLTERNGHFLEAAGAPLNQGGVFMAIGAFHLPGETGMIERLRRAGFMVERVPLPGEVPG